VEITEDHTNEKKQKRFIQRESYLLYLHLPETERQAGMGPLFGNNQLQSADWKLLAWGSRRWAK
jgi:hypothetical protein